MNPNTIADQAIERTLTAERCALGAVLIAPSRLDDLGGVGEADWFRLAHRLIWSAMRRAAEKGLPLDAVTLADQLTPKQLEDVGGLAYIYGLLDGVPRSANAAAYGQQVRDFSMRRKVDAAMAQVLQLARSGEVGGAELVERAETALAALRQAQTGTAVISPLERASSTLSALTDGPATARRRGVFSGLTSLDRLTFGWRPGQLIVIGARPASGKTALALQLAIAAGTIGPVLFASLEMSVDELNLRELAARSGVPHQVLDSGSLGESDLAAVQDAHRRLEAGGVHVLDQAAATLTQIRGAARRLVAQHGPLAAIVVDYLQLMRPDPGTRIENRTIEVGQFSMGLKRLARDLSVPVIALSQLSRESERRTEKQPMLSDLRDSGSLEQDADTVLLLHRPGNYSAAVPADQALLHIAKHRNGPTGLVKLRFSPRTLQFVED